jgi:hypothetical protein
MSLVNQNWIGLNGEPVTGRIPPRLLVMNGVQPNPQQMGMIAHHYKLLTYMMQVSVIPHLVQERTLVDGTRIRMVSSYGTDTVMVWPVGGEAEEPLYWSFIISLKKRPPGAEGTAQEVSEWERIAVERHYSDSPCWDDSSPENSFLVVAVSGTKKLSPESIKDGTVKIMRYPEFVAGWQTVVSRVRSKRKPTPKLNTTRQELIVGEKTISVPFGTVVPSYIAPTECDLFVFGGRIFLLVTKVSTSGTSNLYTRKISLDAATNADFEFELVGSVSIPAPIRAGVEPFGYDVKIVTDESTSTTTMTTEGKLPADTVVSSLKITIDKFGDISAVITPVKTPYELGVGTSTVEGSSQHSFAKYGSLVRHEATGPRYYNLVRLESDLSITVTDYGGARSRFDIWSRATETVGGVTNVFTSVMQGEASGAVWAETDSSYATINWYGSTNTYEYYADLPHTGAPPEPRAAYGVNTLTSYGPLPGDNAYFQVSTAGEVANYPVLPASTTARKYFSIVDFKAALAGDYSWTETSGYQGGLSGSLKAILRKDVVTSKETVVTILADVHAHTDQGIDWSVAGYSETVPPPSPSDNPARFMAPVGAYDGSYWLLTNPETGEKYNSVDAWSFHAYMKEPNVSDFLRQATYTASPTIIYGTDPTQAAYSIVYVQGRSYGGTFNWPSPPSTIVSSGTRFYYNEVNNTFLTQVEMTSKTERFGNTYITTNRIFVGNGKGCTPFEPLLNEWLDAQKIKYKDSTDNQIHPPDESLRFEPNDLYIDHVKLPGNSVF